MSAPAEDEADDEPTTLVVEDGGERLDRYLAARISNSSRSLIQKHIDLGAVTINGAAPKKGSATLLEPGDHIEYVPPPPPPMDLAPEDLPISILLEDDDLIVVDKPAGLVVHPGAGHPTGTLVNALLFHARGFTPDGSLRPGIVHRLDRDTTGLIVVAKHGEAHRRLVAAFQAREVTKEYVAFVVGHPSPRGGTHRTQFGRHPTDRKRFSSKVAEGKLAVTHYETVVRFRGAARLAVRLETGRTHQIRVHFADDGHPLVGDRTYGTRRSLAPSDAAVAGVVEPFPRPALHAHRLVLEHPMTGAELRLEAPVPADLIALQAALEALPRGE